MGVCDRAMAMKSAADYDIQVERISHGYSLWVFVLHLWECPGHPNFKYNINTIEE